MVGPAPLDPAYSPSIRGAARAKGVYNTLEGRNTRLDLPESQK